MPEAVIEDEEKTITTRWTPVSIDANLINIATN